MLDDPISAGPKGPPKRRKRAVASVEIETPSVIADPGGPTTKAKRARVRTSAPRKRVTEQPSPVELQALDLADTPPLSDPERSFVLKRVHVGPDRSWEGLADVISVGELSDYAAHRRIEDAALRGAQASIDRAHEEADSIVERARQMARSLGDTQLKLWQEAFEARQIELSQALGGAVHAVVRAALSNLFEAHPELPVQASIDLAMKVLNSELRAAAVCHPLDLPLVQAHANRLGTSSFNVDPALPRGQLVFEGREGEVRVDGQRVMDRLLNDLRQVLSAKPLSLARDAAEQRGSSGAGHTSDDGLP
ncbi:hypothetical protein BH09PSE5_BH09PSE5_16910 [soil metagenome]